jgi:hypothetical protein
VKNEKSSWERLPDSQNSIVKRIARCEKRLRENLNPIHEGIPTEKAWDNNKLWPKNPIHEGIPTEKA